MGFMTQAARLAHHIVRCHESVRQTSAQPPSPSNQRSTFNVNTQTRNMASSPGFGYLFIGQPQTSKFQQLGKRFFISYLPKTLSETLDGEQICLWLGPGTGFCTLMIFLLTSSQNSWSKRWWCSSYGQDEELFLLGPCLSPCGSRKIN